MNNKNRNHKQTVGKKTAVKKTAATKNLKSNIIIFAVLAAIVIALIILVVYQRYQRGETQSFTDGHQTVTLEKDRSFTARLAHESKSGTYTKKTEGDVTTVTFVCNGETAVGWIIDDTLTLPDEWDDHHGHGSTLKRR